MTCSDPKGAEVVKSLINENLEKFLKRETDHNLSSIRASLNGLNLDLREVRTAKEDPNSTKVFCEATAYVTPNANI
ncbi:MAG: hypothetical protein Q4D82_01235, partial [Neisseria sp.]|nr:hypothetical protein [Neisseria sp.]